MAETPGGSSHGPRPHEQVDFNNFQIAPEGGVFTTRNDQYKVIFRHINCRTQSHSSISYSIDRKYSTYAKITAGLKELDHGQEWEMEVCSGGCNEEPAHQADPDNGISAPMLPEAIAAELHQQAQIVYELAHPQSSQSVEILDIRIRWLRDLPRPAYFSPGRGALALHSKAVTSGHLALIQARGNMDTIVVAFQTPGDQQEQAPESSSTPVGSPRERLAEQYERRRRRQQEHTTEIPPNREDARKVLRLDQRISIVVAIRKSRFPEVPRIWKVLRRDQRTDIAAGVSKNKPPRALRIRKLEVLRLGRQVGIVVAIRKSRLLDVPRILEVILRRDQRTDIAAGVSKNKPLRAPRIRKLEVLRLGRQVGIVVAIRKSRLLDVPRIGKVLEILHVAWRRKIFAAITKNRLAKAQMKQLLEMWRVDRRTSMIAAHHGC
ncbi:hypothetical protein F4777DRAFT_576145 [Nemania sp. FL0916]|nr:hypothetical protein F4777DRAFT_576145 [Nemania sp. FL0916]